MTQENSRVGLKWTIEEEKLLLENIKNNKTIDEISTIHKRNKGGIRSRLLYIAYNKLNDGISMNDIIEITKLSEDEINDYITRKTNKHDIKLVDSFTKIIKIVESIDNKLSLLLGK